MSHRPSCSGITLLEVLVTLSIVAITGAILFSAMNAIAVNSAKNSAINLAHQQTRQKAGQCAKKKKTGDGIPSQEGPPPVEISKF